MSEHEIYKRALQELRRRGHARRDFIDKRGAVCLAGALYLGAGGTPASLRQATMSDDPLLPPKLRDHVMDALHARGWATTDSESDIWWLSDKRPTEEIADLLAELVAQTAPEEVKG